jgi:hypothetical protein
MKQKQVFAIFAAVGALALAALACGGGSAAPTETPPPLAIPTKAPAPTATKASKPTEEPKPTQAAATGEFAVLNQYGYKDQSGYFHVVGEIKNGTDKAVTDIELTIEIKDASGTTLLKDNSDNPADSLTFSPLLSTLDAGEVSPFDYYISSDAGEPDKFNVTITGQHTGQAQRADLNVENDQVVSDGSGDLYITGELVNASDKPAEVHGLAGAMLDDNGNVVGANSYGPITYYLDPAGATGGTDRTPFRVRIDDPGSVATKYRMYWDADTVDPAVFYDVQNNIQNNYFDTDHTYHLVGELTNKSQDALSISLVAGLYGSDHKVLDADTLTAPFDLAPGESVPYSFEGFSVVNNIKDQADALDTYTVQTDAYWTSPSSTEVVSLETAHDDGKTDGNQVWTFTGEVTNTSDKALSRLIVVVGIYDGDKLVAANWTSVDPPEGKDSIASGETNSYKVTVNLDPNVDGSKFKYKTFVQGNVKP